jgi:prepilin-type N-terminal cleavage/methylation domain-containing protein
MKKSNAFTLVELLVVISIIALLLSILIPSLNSARQYARRVVCGSQAKQIGLGLAIYANQNNNKLPSHTVAAYTHLWDLATPTIDAIAKSLGVADPNTMKDIFYCPAASRTILTDELKQSYWDPPRMQYSSSGSLMAWRVVGYNFLLKRPRGFTQPTVTQKTVLVWRLDIRAAATTPIITDFVYYQSSTKRYDYVEEVRGQPMPTGHLKGQMPAGGDIFFVDQHVKWRSFKEMEIHTPGDIRGYF